MATSYLSSSFKEIETELDAFRKIFWCHMDPKRGPFFSLELLHDLHRVYQTLERIPSVQTMHRESDLPFKYVVQASKIPSVFNYGGDLQLFTELIRKKDRDGLRNYAHLCVDALHLIVRKFNLPIVTIALVQGDALGGGFEMVLGNDIIIAEKRAKFGLTEILFNLFPGMGAYSFLARRLGTLQAERMILSGRIYTAMELYDMGLIDALAEDGQGVPTLQKYVADMSSRYDTHRKIFQIRQRFSETSHKELTDITNMWVETAMQLSEVDLRKMERLAAAQRRRFRRVAIKPKECETVDIDQLRQII